MHAHSHNSSWSSSLASKPHPDSAWTSCKRLLRDTDGKEGRRDLRLEGSFAQQFDGPDSSIDEMELRGDECADDDDSEVDVCVWP